MRLYIVTANWGKGGPGGIAADLYKVAISEGWECRFAYGRETIPEDVNSYRIGTQITPYIHAVSSMIFDNAGFVTRRSTLALIKDIEAFKPDVVNLHNPLGYTMNVGILFDFFKRSKIPVVWTIHDIWSITGHCITGMCDHWKDGCGHCPNQREYPASYVFDRSKRNRKRKVECFSNVPNLQLVSPSKWLMNLAEKTYLKQYEINVIPNGIDLDVFKPTASKIRNRYGLENKIILLSVAGVWAKNKGADYIYQLAKLMDERFVFVMIGENKDKELKNNSRILHIEHTTDRKQLAQWYTVADLFVNPTVGDNFPTVNLESLACGTPVVTFATGGSGESVGECGTIVPQGDIETLITSIQDVIDKKIAKETCVEQARCYEKLERYREYLSLFSAICCENDNR